MAIVPLSLIDSCSTVPEQGGSSAFTGAVLGTTAVTARAIPITAKMSWIVRRIELRNWIELPLLSI
jgi:hypothetical protein